MSNNIADLIETYILRQLAANEGGMVEIRRQDIAQKISCAPSQISYVLSTRFTQEKGFLVESRRGLGGFIRIVQMPLERLLYREMAQNHVEATDEAEAEEAVRYLLQQGLLSSRETALLLETVDAAYKHMQPKDRVHFVRRLLLTLGRFS